MELNRIILKENENIRFEKNEKTGEVVMFVCDEPYARKVVPVFNEKYVREFFKKEVEDNKDVVCPVFKEEKEGS